jgi:hypothetical protein
MSEEHMRSHIEERTPAEAQSRAVVIDAAIAKTIMWLAGGAVAASVAMGLWIGVTVQGFEGRISVIEERSEERRTTRDEQIAELVEKDAEAARRLTALEVTVTGIGALKELVNQGFAEMVRRLDSMERNSP